MQLARAPGVWAAASQAGTDCSRHSARARPRSYCGFAHDSRASCAACERAVVGIAQGYTHLLSDPRVCARVAGTTHLSKTRTLGIVAKLSKTTHTECRLPRIIVMQPLSQELRIDATSSCSLGPCEPLGVLRSAHQPPNPPGDAPATWRAIMTASPHCRSRPSGSSQTPYRFVQQSRCSAPR